MSEAIIVALITGGLSLAGVVITCLATAKKTEKATAVAQAVTDTKIEELTREVRAHNNFAQRMPVVEEQIKSINSRVGDLEKYHKEPVN
jgi:F0F1-type ATP synthase gamma subunit